MFNEKINRPIKEEFIICILGPIFQIVFYYVVRNNVDIKSMHYNLLFFNLLPILPLDGSKILNLLLNKILSFRNSLLITSTISIVLIIILFIFSIIKTNLLLVLVLIFLLFKNVENLKREKYIFNRFILERFYSPIKTSKIRYINDGDLIKMKRDRKHIFIINNKYYTEKEIIKKKFDLYEKI